MSSFEKCTGDMNGWPSEVARPDAYAYNSNTYWIMCISPYITNWHNNTCTINILSIGRSPCKKVQ